MHPRRGSKLKTDYAKFSLYLGAASLLGAAGWVYWQYQKTETEMRYRAKYEEAKSAIRQVQQVYGLQPTGKLDGPTRELFLRLAASAASGPVAGPTSYRRYDGAHEIASSS